MTGQVTFRKNTMQLLECHPHDPFSVYNCCRNKISILVVDVKLLKPQSTRTNLLLRQFYLLSILFSRISHTALRRTTSSTPTNNDVAHRRSFDILCLEPSIETGTSPQPHLATTSKLYWSTKRVLSCRQTPVQERHQTTDSGVVVVAAAR
ncbi:unnamed protein product [Amoebophrya sp. A120]|nr:unnamed protein product [Amoebophrya sp. A120]|eukprot:GSA120T00000681001.1